MSRLSGAVTSRSQIVERSTTRATCCFLGVMPGSLPEGSQPTKQAMLGMQERPNPTSPRLVHRQTCTPLDETLDGSSPPHTGCTEFAASGPGLALAVAAPGSDAWSGDVPSP